MKKLLQGMLVTLVVLCATSFSYAQSKILGSAKVCVGAAISLSDTSSAGIWSADDTTIATVDPQYGIVTGVNSGTTTISYTTTAGSVVVTATVNPLPSPIADPGIICAKSLATLTDVDAGGKWSTATTTVATIAATTGVLTPKAAGVAIITYKLATGCMTTSTLTVNPIPAAITGSAMVCTGAKITLNDATAGGSWDIVDTGIATIATIDSITGQVSGVSVGTTTVSYTSIAGCSTIKKITVNGPPSGITGPDVVCMISSITLLDSMTGKWTSSTPAVAAVGVNNGIVTGRSAGTATITFTSTAGCGVTKAVTVNPVPSPIAGTASICYGLTTNLSCYAGCGAWCSSNTSVATICSGGTVTGLAAGSTTITFTLSTGCGMAIKKITVYPNPSCITGIDSVCAGSVITLSDCGGGRWSTSDPDVASVSPQKGTVTGVAAGIVNISYTLSSGCLAAKSIKVTDCSGSAAKNSDGGNDASTADDNTASKMPMSSTGTLHIYPNPNSGSFNLLISADCDESGTVSVTNILGQKVMELPITSNNAIPVTMPQIQASGIYLVTVTTTGGTYQEKVIIKK